jgi:hypothetical protein
VDLQNDFTTGDNRYPKNRQQTLHLLDKYSKTVVARATQSEGASFVQRGGRGASEGKRKDSKTFDSLSPGDKKYWKDKTCYKCHKKGHPATHCTGSVKEDDDTSIASTKSSVSKLKKDCKTMEKGFTTVNTQLAQLKESESDISESDAEEERDVAVIDCPNAFIQTRVNDEKDMAFIKIRGALVDILVEIAPDVYGPYVTLDKKGVKQLLVQCQNAIYGAMVASLLYYRKFVKSLTDIDFFINPYDPCVANKTIEGEQMTICFHVDDCKLSHRKTKVMDRMIEHLRQEYERIFEDGSGAMTVSRGKVHKYLGMTLDYTVRGQVKITMFDYIEEIITAFDKAEPKGAGTKSSARPRTYSESTKTVRKSSRTSLWSFTT